MHFSFFTKTACAITIDSSFIRIVCVSDDDQVQQAIIVPTPPNTFVRERIVDVTSLAAVIQPALAPLHPRPSRVSFCLPDSSCFIHRFAVAAHKDEKMIQAAIVDQASTLIPADHNTVLFDYRKDMPIDGKAETITVVYVSALREIIAQYKALAAECKVAVEFLGVEGLALKEVLLIKQADASKAQTRMLVTMNHFGANFNVFNVKDEFLFSGTVPFLTDNLTAKTLQLLTIQISGTNETSVPSLQLNTAKPEEVTALQNAVQSFVNEIKAAQAHAETVLHVRIDAIILAGEIARVQNIALYFSKLLAIPVVIGDPLLLFSKSASMFGTDNPAILCATALGTAVLDLSRDKQDTINLLRRDIQEKEVPKEVSFGDRVEALAQQESRALLHKKIAAICFTVITFGILVFVVYKYVIAPFL